MPTILDVILYIVKTNRMVKCTHPSECCIGSLNYNISKLFYFLPDNAVVDKSRRQNKSNLRTELYFQQGRNCCWKRRNRWLPGPSPFPAMFSKNLYLQVEKKQGLFSKGFNREGYMLFRLEKRTKIVGIHVPDIQA